MTTMTIKKGDQVQVIAGREKGKKGTVEQTIPERSRVVIAGVNLRKHHLKPSRTRPKGGIVEVPAPLSRANVMVICPHCSKPVRIRHTATDAGKRYRTCSICSSSLDA